MLVRSTEVRSADAQLVLDKLTSLDLGENPDAEHRALPHGIAGSLDLTRVGMFGHSLGGASTAVAMSVDRRIRAGANLDGIMHGPVTDLGLDRPFLLMSRQNHGHVQFVS